MIRTRRRCAGDLTAFAAARTTSNACYRFVGPFIATIARGLDVKLADIGVAIAVSELFGLASPVIGRVVDRLGARRAVAVGLGARNRRHVPCRGERRASPCWRSPWC